MARRRLSAETRRAEIIEIAAEAIAAEGYSTLSLREIARRAGMSVPGLIRYFPTMGDLLAAVLQARDETEFPQIQIDDSCVIAAIDSIIEYYAAHRSRARSFDVLEGEALNPAHPAHDYFAGRNRVGVELLRPLIDREFADPDGVSELLTLVLEGARLRALQHPGGHVVDPNQLAAGWQRIKGVIDSLPRNPDFPR